MLTGTADVNELSASAPTIESWCEDAIDLPEVHLLQLTAEMSNAAREAVLPPSLHPVVPPTLSIQAWDVPDSHWGAFQMLVSRVYCRSGARARGYTTAALTDNDAAAAGLSSSLGFPLRIADIRFRHGYDGGDVVAVVDGNECLNIHAVDPEPMGLDDVQYTSTLNLAHTPNGLRMVQVEARHETSRVDRLTASLAAFDGAVFGNPLLDPRRVVSASLTRSGVVFPAVRFVCKVDELAFTGTEPVKSA